MGCSPQHCTVYSTNDVQAQSFINRSMLKWYNNNELDWIGLMEYFATNFLQSRLNWVNEDD